MSRRPLPLAERFWPKVDKTGRAGLEVWNGLPCWIWLASLDGKGYGQINAGFRPTKMRRAHRVSYELCVGSIPVGLDLDHLCRNPRCVNPKHLEPTTRKVNLLRGDTVTARHASRIHCPKGHPYDEANTAYAQKSNGNHSRYCMTCNRIRSQRHRDERKSL